MKKILLAITVLATMAFSGDYKDGISELEKGYTKKGLTLMKKYFGKEEYADGIFFLGLNYTEGTMGVKQNYSIALILFQESADYGDRRALVMLGNAYDDGLGVEINKIKAYEYWKEAAKKGEPKAIGNLDRLCKNSPWACK